MRCGKNNNQVKVKTSLSKSWAWGGSFGKDVRVALIDSGVDRTHPKITEDSIFYEESLLDTTVDDAGHGTACANILLEVAPQIELISIKVLDAGLKGECSDLIVALQWCLDNNIAIINLSLGCNQESYKLEFFELLEKIHLNGIIVVVANSNDVKEKSYPAGFSSVITVVSHEKEHEGKVFSISSLGIDFSAFAHGRELAWKNHSYKVVLGNSFATPYITGRVACIKSKHPHLKPYEIKSILHHLSDNIYKEKTVKIPHNYQVSLEKISKACTEISFEVFGIDLPLIVFEYIEVEEMEEQNLVNDYSSKITIYSINDSIFLSPLEGGSNMIYGITHEIGHILVSHLLEEKFLPAVIWDEALAHYFAINLFIPKLWEKYAESLWLDYPNYLEDNGVDMLENVPLTDYISSLKRMTLILDELVKEYGYINLKKALENMSIEDMESWNFSKRLKSELVGLV